MCNTQLKLSTWLNKYTSQIKLRVPSNMLSEIPVYNIPHPTIIEQNTPSHTVLTWHIKGHMDRKKALQWYNDIVTKISLCLDGESLVENVNKELTMPVNEYIYELEDFAPVEDLRYWRGKKIFINNSSTSSKGDYQFDTIRNIAYALKRGNILTMDKLRDEALQALNNDVRERWFKYQIKSIYTWTMKNYVGKYKRDTTSRTDHATMMNKDRASRTLHKVRNYYQLCVNKHIKPSIKEAIRVTKLSRNTILKYLAKLPKLRCQSRQHIRGKRGHSLFASSFQSIKNTMASSIHHQDIRCWLEYDSLTRLDTVYKEIA